MIGCFQAKEIHSAGQGVTVDLGGIDTGRSVSFKYYRNLSSQRIIPDHRNSGIIRNRIFGKDTVHNVAVIGVERTADGFADAALERAVGKIRIPLDAAADAPVAGDGAMVAEMVQWLNAASAPVI